VVARSARPSWRGFLRYFGDPYAQLVYPLYAFLYRLAARHEARWIPEAVGAQRARLIEYWGELPSARDNDGISPTNSQLWGELVHAANADHLDVVGHFGDTTGDVPAGDWLPSRSGFTLADFQRLWSDVAAFILGAAHADGAETTQVGTARTEHDLNEPQ
jgi:hypothetical protein